MNKRGIGKIVIPILVTIVIIVMFTIIMVMSRAALHDRKEQIYENKLSYNAANRNMVVFLNTPLKYKGASLTIKELLIVDYLEYKKNGDIGTFDNLHAKSTLDAIYKGLRTYKFSISDKNEIYSVKGDDYPKSIIVKSFSKSFNDLIITLEESYDE